MGDHVERAFVAEGRPNPLEQARHGLEIVREHLRTGAEHRTQLVGLAVEVGDEQFDAGLRVLPMDLANRLGVEPRAAVEQVVAGNAGHGRVSQVHRGDRLRDPTRLVSIEGGRPSGVDLAEIAAPGALLAADEERRLAVLPALVDVGAARLLAHGVQAGVR